MLEYKHIVGRYVDINACRSHLGVGDLSLLILLHWQPNYSRMLIIQLITDKGGSDN
jgi:hypothetical protein